MTISILYFHLRLGLPNGFFHSGFQIKILYALVISPTRVTGFGIITDTRERRKSLSNLKHFFNHVCRNTVVFNYLHACTKFKK